MAVRLVPGAVLDGRYRLDERLGPEWPATRWRAEDIALARSVTVLAQQAGTPAAVRMLTAARRAARIRDARVAQVYDADTVDDVTFVVTESVSGRTLADLLATDGPLPPERAGALVRECAEALAAAQRMAVPHFRLTPDHVVWTPSGTVKLTGVGLDTALAGPTTDDAGRVDAAALGALLYAALTARWPTGPFGQLQAAPKGGAGLLSAHQVRAGIPIGLDVVADRALGTHAWRGSPLPDAAAVAEALGDYRDLASPEPDDAAATQPVAVVTRAKDTAPRRARRRVPAVLAVPALAVLITVLVTTISWTGVGAVFSPPAPSHPSALSHPSSAPSTSASPTPTASPSPTATPTATGSSTPVGRRQIPVAAVTAFDPFGSGSEHPELVDNAIDGTDRTDWHTHTYTTAQFGNLKPGVGLLFDLGAPTSVAAVRVQLVGTDTSLQLRASDDLGRGPTAYQKLGQVSAAGHEVSFEPHTAATARYWLVWITQLPAVPGGYRAGISDVAFLPPA